MRHVGPFFPGGGTGAGLLLIRLSVSASLLIAASVDNLTPVRLPLALLLSAPIAIGYGTRIATGLSICLISYLYVTGHGSLLGSTPQIVTALALVLTGPGAFSLDAYVFGRSTIVMAGRSNAGAAKGDKPTPNDPPDRGAQR
jgi:putative oxidoreductase